MDEQFELNYQSDRFLPESEKLTVSQFIKPWIETKCYPLVRIEESEDGKFQLFQNCISLSEGTRDLAWPIHVTYVTSTGKTGQFVFSSQVFEVTIALEADEAVWFNHKMLGFYLPLQSSEYF